MSISTSQRTTQTSSVATSTSVATTTPVATEPTSEFPLTPPAPDKATPPMATTPKPIPDYHETPSIHALLGKDKNAYLACLFKGATESNVVLTASILIDGKVVLTKTVTGNTGIAMFSVSKINDNLFLKKVCIKQNIKASLWGLFFYLN